MTSNLKVFQIDNELVIEKYKEKNYIIEYNENVNENYVVIYFSSNGIYFPNDEETFRKEILQSNRFEWYRNKLDWAKKHIFVRDLFKQWYVEGINNELNSIDKLAEFFRKETQGYKVITVGSSAGAYAASLFGVLLNAEHVIAFSPQFSLYPQISESNPSRDPLLFKYLDDKSINKYFDLSNLIDKSSVPIFYIAPYYSKKDEPQIKLASSLNNLKSLFFNAKVHGVPVKIPCAAKIIRMDMEQLNDLFDANKGKVLNATWFSYKTLGLIPFFKFGYIMGRKKLKRIFFNND